MSIEKITGIILAGGRARRMGGADKGLVDLGGTPMVAHVAHRLKTQVKQIIISANRNTGEYQRWSDQVVADMVGEFDGPLAGMASGLQLVDTPYAATVPCDSPLLATDLTERLYSACLSESSEIAVAHDGERLQPVFSLVRSSLGSSIVAFLEAGERKIDKWFEQHSFVVVDFSDKPESFLNINTPDDKLNVLNRIAQLDSGS